MKYKVKLRKQYMDEKNDYRELFSHGLSGRGLASSEYTEWLENLIESMRLSQGERQPSGEHNNESDAIFKE